MSNPNDHAGSGIDQAHPKSLLEKLGDGAKSVLPKKPEPQPPGQTGPGIIVPPAD
jgi:hypothetical protein